MMAISKCINIKVVALLLFAVAVLAVCVANSVLVKNVKKSSNKMENKSRRHLADHEYDDELYNAWLMKRKPLRTFNFSLIQYYLAQMESQQYYLAKQVWSQQSSNLATLSP